VAKLKEPYNVRFHVLIQIIYQKEKVFSFNNMNVIMLMKADREEIINLANIMYKHLIKELNRWFKARAEILEGKVKANPKKDIYNFVPMIEVVMEEWFPKHMLP